MTTNEFCCEMRRKFLVNIVREDRDVPTPTELADFVLDWERDRPLIGIKYCPFCGKLIDHQQTLRE